MPTLKYSSKKPVTDLYAGRLIGEHIWQLFSNDKSNETQLLKTIGLCMGHIAYLSSYSSPIVALPGV